MKAELAIVSPDLKCILLEPGIFRTEVLGEIKSRKATTRISNYAKLNEEIATWQRGAYETCKGDPDKGVKVMVDIIKGEGKAAGKDLPNRIPVGPDALEAVREACRLQLAVCDEWETIVRLTEFDPQD